jgi:hypothetical protein
MPKIHIKGGATLWARQTIDSEIFKNKPAVWFKIWFYLVSKANHKNSEKLKKGEVFVRYSALASEIGCTTHTLKGCLRWLRQSTMIDTARSTRGTRVLVNKYGHFQTLKNYSNTARNSEQTPTRLRPDSEQTPRYNKNEKKKEENNILNNNLKSPKKKTDIVLIVEHFFEMKAWDATVDQIFAKHVRPAKELLDTAGGDVMKAKKAITKLSKWADLHELNWNLNTVVKKWFEIPSLVSEKKKRAFIENDPAYQKNGDWYVINHLNEHVRWIGSLDKVRYE